MPYADGRVGIHIRVGGPPSPEGQILMLVTRTGPSPTEQEDTRSRLRSVLALLRLALGPNVAFEPVDDVIHTGTQKIQVAESGRGAPMNYPPPNLSPAGLQSIFALDDAIRRLDGQTRNRVELSLQWFFRASEAYGVDGFLMYWFALDVLAMPRGSGLSSVEGQMAEIYDLELPEIRKQFRLGKLLGLRDGIVHEGLHPQIQTTVLDYLATVYWDLLLHALKMSPHRVADWILGARDIDDWFPEAHKKPGR